VEPTPLREPPEFMIQSPEVCGVTPICVAQGREKMTSGLDLRLLMLMMLRRRRAL
jgi:hypothetical protein